MEKKMTLKKSKFTKLSKEKQRVLVGGKLSESCMSIIRNMK